MKKEIFIALHDFESPNKLAIYGAHLAKKLDRYAFLFGVSKIPLNTPPVVLTDTTMSNTLAAEMDNLEMEAEQKLQAISLNLESIYPHVYYDTGIGFTEPTIIKKTEKRMPYMILLEGFNEPTTLHEWFGTYETRLAENTEVPALIVPASSSWKTINNILYIMDLEDEKVENMRYLSELSKKLGAQLTVATITDNEKNNDDEQYAIITNTLRELLGYEDVKFHRVFSNDAAETVENLITQTNADWLSFEHKSRTFLERVFSDYNTKHLILHSEKPVLVL